MLPAPLEASARSLSLGVPLRDDPTAERASEGFDVFGRSLKCLGLFPVEAARDRNAKPSLLLVIRSSPHRSSRRLMHSPRYWDQRPISLPTSPVVLDRRCELQHDMPVAMLKHIRTALPSGLYAVYSRFKNCNVKAISDGRKILGWLGCGKSAPLVTVAGRRIICDFGHCIGLVRLERRIRELNIGSGWVRSVQPPPDQQRGLCPRSTNAPVGDPC